MDKFRKEVIKELENVFGDGYQVLPYDKLKNNETTLHGICIHNENERISPVLYLEEYVLPYAAGKMTVKEIAAEMLDKYCMGDMPRNIADHVEDFQMMKDRVRIKVINYGANTRRLQQVPHRRFLDLAMPAPDHVRHKTYSTFFSMLVLADTHRKNLLKRGFTEQQIEENGYKSTPVFGYKKLTERLLAAGCTVEGVPGFYQDKDGEWTIHFSNKSSGFLVPVRNMDGLIVGAQIRLDHPYDGRKYIWLSSTNFNMGTSSGSPVHLAGSPGEKTIFITEGPLKGDLAHALSGRIFGCVPGANQYANLPPFLREMKQMGTQSVYEAYDMDKLLKTACRGDYNEKCTQCENYRKDWKQKDISCEKKCVKRQNIQRGCQKLTQICRELGLSVKTLTWDMDGDGDWAEHVKGVDDYLYDLEQKKQGQIS